MQFPFGQLQLFKHALFSHAMPLKSASQIHRETGNSTRHQPLFEQPCGQSRMEQSSPINGGTHLARKTIIMNYFSKEFSHNIENIIQIKLVNNSVIFRKSNNVNMGKGKTKYALTRAPTVADASRRSWMLRIAWHFALLERAISEVPLCIMVAVRSMAARLADLKQ